MVAVCFNRGSMKRADYDECIRRLEVAGAGHPRGRVYHACYGNADRIRVFDVWESVALFEKFGETLMPILADLGADAGEPEITQILNVIRPVQPA